MNFWETITGSDLTRDWKAFHARAQALPADYQVAWEQITDTLMTHYGDFTARNLTPIADTALSLLEEAAAEGQSVVEVMGNDVPGFCTALVGGKGARTYRDRWREELNNTVARKLARLGG